MTWSDIACNTYIVTTHLLLIFPVAKDPSHSVRPCPRAIDIQDAPFGQMSAHPLFEHVSQGTYANSFICATSSVRVVKHLAIAFQLQPSRFCQRRPNAPIRSVCTFDTQHMIQEHDQDGDEVWSHPPFLCSWETSLMGMNQPWGLLTKFKSYSTRGNIDVACLARQRLSADLIKTSTRERDPCRPMRSNSRRQLLHAIQRYMT